MRRTIWWWPNFNTYFVGDARVLTHDITIPQMVTGGVPGELAAR